VNVEQVFIVTTEDKVRICLNRHLDRVERRRDWIAPLGVLITLVVTLVTTTFRDLWLSKDAWQALFIFAAFGAAVWLMRALVALYTEAKTSMDSVILEMKTSAVANEVVQSKVEVTNSPVTSG